MTWSGFGRRWRTWRDERSHLRISFSSDARYCRSALDGVILTSHGHSFREDLGPTVQGDQGNQTALRREERARLPDSREAVELRPGSRAATGVRERTATLLGGGVADLQRIRNCGLRCEPEAQAAENRAQPAVPAVSSLQVRQLLSWDPQTD